MHKVQRTKDQEQVSNPAASSAVPEESASRRIMQPSDDAIHASFVCEHFYNI